MIDLDEVVLEHVLTVVFGEQLWTSSEQELYNIDEKTRCQTNDKLKSQLDYLIK